MKTKAEIKKGSIEGAEHKKSSLIRFPGLLKLSLRILVKNKLQPI